MSISQEQLAEIAESVWSSFLGMSIHKLEASESLEVTDRHPASATVHISGSWNGSVILSGSTTLTRRAAAAMFEIAEADLDDADIADAFGELANIIGGNLKCLLPEPSQLSLPTVSFGAAHVVTVPGAGLLEDVELECDGDRLRIAVWNKRDDQRNQRREHRTELEGVVR
ncbi:MAG: chemotaxis protein CheX [Actinomycetota bacterium]|jgi:chemotaxis protein CheX|nr:chemotaxis protein CheX [Actinomycetota bacterium]